MPKAAGGQPLLPSGSVADKDRTGFSMRLEEAMRAAGYSQNRLEVDAGLSSGYLSKIFAGSRGARIETEIIRALSDVLGVSTDYLIKGFDGADPYPERASVVRQIRAGKYEPPEVIERLYGDRYRGRADLSRDGWMKALKREHNEWLQERMAEAAEERKPAAKKKYRPHEPAAMVVAEPRKRRVNG